MKKKICVNINTFRRFLILSCVSITWYQIWAKKFRKTTKKMAYEACLLQSSRARLINTA